MQQENLTGEWKRTSLENVIKYMGLKLSLPTVLLIEEQPAKIAGQV